MPVAAKTITVRNGSARFALHPAGGRFDLAPAPGKSLGLFGATAAVALDGGPTVTLADCRLVRSSADDRRIEAVYRSGSVTLDLVVAPAARRSAFRIELAVTNSSRKNIPVKALLPVCTDEKSRFALGLSDRSLKVLRNAFGPWEATAVVGLLEPHFESAGDDALYEPGDSLEVKGLVRSAQLSQIRGKGFFLTAGFLSASRQFGLVSIAARGSDKGPAISAAALADGKPVATGRRYHAEPLYVGFAGDRWSALTDYGSLAGEETEARRAPEVPCGWTSAGAPEKDCLATLKFLAANRRTLPLHVFLIDSPWQARIGDWSDASPAFPRGMKALADDLRAARLSPGISFAPFAVSAGSKLFRDNPGLVVGTPSGEPLCAGSVAGEDVFVLDLTNPSAIGRIAEAVSAICHDWGFDYVKLDSLYLATLSGSRLDDTKTRAQNLSRGLEVIRQVAGPEKYIAASGCPFGPAAGIADAFMLTTGEATPAALSGALLTGWAHNLLFHSDLGLHVDAAAATSHDAALGAALLSGGAFWLFGSLSDLPAARLDLLKSLFPLPTAAAAPLDLYGASMPSEFLAAGDAVLLGLFNWTDSKRTCKLNLPRILAPLPLSAMADFPSGSPSPVPSAAHEVSLEPRSSRLIRFS